MDGGSIVASQLSVQRPSSVTSLHFNDATLSAGQAAFNLFKASIGLGILGLPGAFKHAGLWLGMAGMMLIGLVSLHCMLLMVECAGRLRERLTTEETLADGMLDYHDVAEWAMRLGPAKLSRYHGIWRKVALASLIFVQASLVTTYTAFCGRILQELVATFTESSLDNELYILLVFPVIFITCMITDFRATTVFSMAGTVCTFATFGVAFYMFFSDGFLPLEAVDAVAPPEKWGLFFGSAVFAFEMIGVMLPIENKLRDKRCYGGAFGLVTLVATLYTCLATSVGFYGYLSVRGGSNAGLLLDQFPTTAWIYPAARLAYMLSIMMTCNVQFYPIIKFTFPTIREKIIASWYARPNVAHDDGNEEFVGDGMAEISPQMNTAIECAWRAFLLALMTGVALAVPCLESLISLTGACFSAMICIIIPPISHLLLFYDEAMSGGTAKWRWRLIMMKNVLLSLFGVCGAVLGVVVAVEDIAEKMRSGECHY